MTAAARRSSSEAVAATAPPTVSQAFIRDWLDTLTTHCTPAQLSDFLTEVELDLDDPPIARVTHDQIVRLYQLVAVETGDEMMGLWSRPIRSGALKHICNSVRTASTLGAAMFRFVTFWNLVLDDHRLVLETGVDELRVGLVHGSGVTPHRFAHTLLLKLAHGIASWIAGRELPLVATGFAFAEPEFAEDYPILFPSRIGFDQDRSFIAFERSVASLPVRRTTVEMHEFLVRAPRDWIFTSSHDHTLALRVRDHLLADRLDDRLADVAAHLNMSPRTLIRHLDAEGTSFQRIHDGVRRDLAIHELAGTTRSVEAIARQVGFSSGANFHRAFKRWTGTTPGSYR